MRRLISLLVAGVLLLILVMPAAAGVSARWHRLNPFETNNGEPEHERFSCITGDAWRCRYDKEPEERLGGPAAVQFSQELERRQAVVDPAVAA